VTALRPAGTTDGRLGGRADGRMSTLGGAAGLGEFGVELGADEQRGVRRPQPHKEDDDPRQGPVHPVIRIRVRGVEREDRRSDESQPHGASTPPGTRPRTPRVPDGPERKRISTSTAARHTSTGHFMELLASAATSSRPKNPPAVRATPPLSTGAGTHVSWSSTALLAALVRLPRAARTSSDLEEQLRSQILRNVLRLGHKHLNR
jgi:hypothetical protein